MNKTRNLSVYSNIFYIGGKLWREDKESIDEKIQQKQELISSIETRLEHEKKELEELLNEKQHEVKVLNDFLKTSGMSYIRPQKYYSNMYPDNMKQLRINRAEELYNSTALKYCN